MLNNYVIIKGKSDRLLIHLDDKVDFDSIKKNLENKLVEAKNFIGSAKMAIKFEGRTLSENEENELVNIIKNSCDLTITFVLSENRETDLILEDVIPITEQGITKFHYGTLRSGSILDFSGNVVVVGNVNPGAFIKADGSIIVLGFLNGSVLVRDPNAFIGAVSLNPVQLTIGRYISKPFSKNSLDTNKVKKDTDFKIARLVGDKIVIKSISYK